MRSDTVVGYTYRAEVICPTCIVEVARRVLDEQGYAIEPDSVPGVMPLTAEGVLNAMATIAGINRQDESSFDSDDFPKVLFADQADGMACDGCEEALL